MDPSCIFIGKRRKKNTDFLYELEESPKIVNNEIVSFYKHHQFHIQKFVVIHSRMDLRMMNFSGKSFVDQVLSSCTYKELLKEALELNSV